MVCWECVQHGLALEDQWVQVVPPGSTTVYSWTDPEKSKGRKLLCNLNQVDPDSGERIKTLKKLEIDLDNLEYASTFIG